MKQSIFLGLLFATQSLSIAAQNWADGALLDYNAVQSDMDFLLQQLKENHPGLYLYASPDEVERHFKADSTMLPGDVLSCFEQFVVAVDAIHDGHTSVQLGDELSDDILFHKKFFPFTLKIIEGKVWVNHNFSEYDFLERGTEIISINHIPALEVFNSLRPFVTCDGYDRDAKLEQLEGQFWWYYGLKYGYRESFMIEYREQGSREVKNLVASALGYSDRFDMLSEVYGFSWTSDEKIAFRVEDGTAILTINQFFGVSKVVYSAFLENCFRKIQKLEIEHLIIDIRRNGGGREGFENLLFSYLDHNMLCKYDEIYALNLKSDHYDFMEHGTRCRMQDWLFRQFEFENEGEEWVRKRDRFHSTLADRDYKFEGDVYVLIGGQVFSSGADFAAMAKAYVKDCTLIGTETLGGCVANNSGYYYRLVLPNTGFKVTIPRVHFRLNIEADNPGGGVLPHWVVKPSISDFVQGNDVVLNKAFELISSRAQRMSYGDRK